MQFNKYFMVVLASLSSFLLWGTPAQAQDDANSEDGNSSQTETTTGSNGANTPDSFGEFACLSISDSLKDKINRKFIQENRLIDLTYLNSSDLDKEVDKIDEAKSFPLKLHYLRNAKNIVETIKKIKELNKTSSNNQSQDCPLYLTNYGNDTLILHGETRFIEHVYRIIAAMDLPRPGINMEIYGIQVSSKNPNKMAKAMSEVRKEISKTQLLIQETYTTMQQLARTIEVDDNFKKILEEDLRYEFTLDIDRPLTLTDILILLSATKDENIAQNTLSIAQEMSKRFKQERFKEYTKALNKMGLCPFEGFFRSRGLKLTSDNLEQSTSDNSQIKDEICTWEIDTVKRKGKMIDVPRANALAARSALLDFALHYSDLIDNPNDFDPYSLQQSSDVLNTKLRSTINIINRDIENMFMLPTLDNIRKIVRGYNSVTFAQIGKTTVAGLSGLSSSVTGKVQSNFYITPPLRLTELLKKTAENKNAISPLLPGLLSPVPLTTADSSQQSSNGSENEGEEETSDENAEEDKKDGTSAITPKLEPTVGPFPLSTFLGVLAAYDDPTRTQRLTIGRSGPNLTVTPHVLRNMSSAELNLNLKIGDPLEGTSEIDRKSGEALLNLSRVTEHEVETTVYVDAVDLFTISTFSNQSTIDGGRGYVPIIGTIWRGIFSNIPLIGNLFSWKKGTQSVLHESVLLTNSYITPTVMGLALKYPITGTSRKLTFEQREDSVKSYKESLGRTSESNNTGNQDLIFEPEVKP